MKISFLVYTATPESEYTLGALRASAFGDFEILSGSGPVRAKVWNDLAHQAVGDVLVFLGDRVGFADDWLQPILDAVTESNVVIPRLASLDIGSWRLSGAPSGYVTWDWRLVPGLRSYDYKHSPCFHPVCFAMQKARFVSLGGFDPLLTDGECIGFSVIHLANGGSIDVVNSVVGSDYEFVSSVFDRSRLANTVFSRFKQCISGLSDDFGSVVEFEKRYGDLLIDGVLCRDFPHLVSLQKFRTFAPGSVSIVNPHASIVGRDLSRIRSSDLVIGVDRAFETIQCDLIYSNDFNVARDYSGGRLLPLFMFDKGLSSFVRSADFFTNVDFIDLLPVNAVPTVLESPFVDVGFSCLTALHFACVLKPKVVRLYGFERRFLDDKYWLGEGPMVSEGRFGYFEQILRHLAGLARKSGTQVISEELVW